MLSVEEIRQFHTIIDGEIDFIVKRANARIDKLTYLKKTFNKACYELAKAEGLIKEEV